MIFNYIYTTFLTILYTLVMSFALGGYLKEHKKNYLLITLYFLLLILNGLLVTMSETFKTFASDYNRQFMVNPIIETLYYLAIFAIALKLINELLGEKIKSYQYGIYIVFALWLIVVPFFSNSALKVWLYYFPSQAVTIYMGIYLLKHYRKIEQSIVWRNYAKWLGLLALIFGIAIVSEDTFVIFFRDIYHANMLKIHNRNVSEDIFHISLCIVAIKYFLFNYKTNSVNQIIPSSLDMVNIEVDEENVVRTDEEASYFDKFVATYGITQREAEILDLLIKRKHNQEIANQLYLSLGTVKTHTHNIFIKLQIERRSDVCEVWENFKKSEKPK